MKYAKMLGLLAVAAAALMAFAGSASATELTTTDGGVHKMVETGATIEATNSANAVLDGTINITCKKSTVSGKTTNTGGSSETVKGNIESLTFTECGTATVTVSKGGTLEVHTDTTTLQHKEGPLTDLGTHTVANGNGTLTSSGAEVTILTHNILGTIHCVYVTNNTLIGTVDGSDNTGGTATMTIDSAQIPISPTAGFGCGETAEWTAEYTVTNPDHLDID